MGIFRYIINYLKYYFIAACNTRGNIHVHLLIRTSFRNSTKRFQVFYLPANNLINVIYLPEELKLETSFAKVHVRLQIRHNSFSCMF